MSPIEEQSPPRVTALIVARNCEAALRSCLRSLERSTNRDRLEILVVDDHSDEDGTSRVPDEFPEVIALNIPKRVGWTRAVNIGLRTAKGDFILLLHPWFEVEPDTVTALADRLEQAAGTGAVCPRTEMAWRFPTPADLMTAWKTGELPGGEPVSGEQAVDYPQGAPLMTRRELLRAMNYLDERFGDNWSDLEMCSRIRDGGKTILVLSHLPVRALDVPDEDLTQLEWTDSAHGVATWIGLHQGFMAGFTARLNMAFHALGRGKTSAFLGILTGSKIDGNQG